MEGIAHAFKYSIVLLLAEFLLFLCAETRIDDSIKVLVSRNGTCHESFRLSTSLQYYKIIFPKRDSRCDDCSNCNKFSTWNCQLNFEIDPFTLKIFEVDVCIDQKNQGLTNCDTSHIFYQIGSESRTLKQNRTCDVTYRPTCRSFRDKVKISVAFTSAFPCSFNGHSDVYLRFRDPPPYVLFKEDCPYTNFTDHPLELTNGTIVSEFDHRLQKSTEFCPVLLRDGKKKHMRLCVWMEVNEFPKSKFAITISTVVPRRKWIAFDFHTMQRIYCQNVHPAGYIVSAITDPEENSLNNHRVVLKYWLVKKDTDGGDSDDNEDVHKKTDRSGGISISTTLLLVMLLGVPAVGFICAIFRINYMGKITISSFVRRQTSRIEEFFQSLCRRSQTQAGPTAANQSSGRPHSSVNESDSLSSGYEISLNGHSQPPLTPSAPLVAESEFMLQDVTSDPPSYDNVLPSYQYLFPSREA